MNFVPTAILLICLIGGHTMVWLTFNLDRHIPGWMAPARRRRDHGPRPRFRSQAQPAGGLRRRIRADALSASIQVEALKVAEIIRRIMEASITRRFCSPSTRNCSSTTDHVPPDRPLRQ